MEIDPIDDQPPVPGGTTAIRHGQYVREDRAPGPPSPRSKHLLTPKERMVLAHMAKTGDTAIETAAALGLSEQTVKNHLTNAYRQLGVHNLTGAFIALGWLKVK